MPSATISSKLTNHIDEYARLAEVEIRGAMEDIANNATTIAKHTLGTSHHTDDSIHRGIHPMPVTNLGSFWRTGVIASDWKSNFFEKGTHAHSIAKHDRQVFSFTATGRQRKRKLKSDDSFVSGVTAYNFLKVGIREASKGLRMIIGARFARIRV